jgi:hypothetical protein
MQEKHHIHGIATVQSENTSPHSPAYIVEGGTGDFAQHFLHPSQHLATMRYTLGFAAWWLYADEPSAITSSSLTAAALNDHAQCHLQRCAPSRASCHLECPRPFSTGLYSGTCSRRNLRSECNSREGECERAAHCTSKWSCQQEAGTIDSCHPRELGW